MVPVFKNVGERSTAKNDCPVSLLSVVSKAFEKLVNNRIVDHLNKCGLFSDIWYGFRSFQSTEDLLTVAPNRSVRVFNKSGATRAVALNISKVFDRVWCAGLLHKLKSMEIQVRYLALLLLFSVIDAFEWFWMAGLHKNIRLMLEFLKAPFLVLHFSYHTLMTFLMMLSVLLKSIIVHTGYKVPPEKTLSHLQSQFPPEMTLLQSQQNFQTHLKSNFMFTPISNICFKKLSR